MLAALLAAAVPAARAGIWQGAPGVPGDWFDPNNWIGGVPTLGDSVEIENGGTVVVAGDAGAGGCRSAARHWARER